LGNSLYVFSHNYLSKFFQIQIKNLRDPYSTLTHASMAQAVAIIIIIIIIIIIWDKNMWEGFFGS
jgi:hypothetical protein